MSRFRMPRAFGHPLFLGALALLVINDHLLKGAGVLPGALTGKLSDFAGMLVAPPLLALLLGCGAAPARAVAAIAVGVGFAAIKLSPEAARGLEQLLHALQLRSRIWVDASDLIALVLLPVGHALSRPRAAHSALAPRTRAWLERGAIAVAACACLATTGSDDDGEGARYDAPEIENKTDADIRVILSSTEGAGGCRIYRDDRVAALTADAFGSSREIVLEPEGRAALTAQRNGDIACGAASIRLEDGDGLRVFWRELPDIEDLAEETDKRRAARRIAITGQPSSFDFDIGDDLTTFTLGGETPESNCPATAPAYSLEWSALTEGSGFLELGEIRPDVDGCLEVDWFESGGDTSPLTQRLCIPDWAFPFASGDRLAVVQSVDPLGGRALRLTHSNDDGMTELLLWNEARELKDSRATDLAPIDCVGNLVECGAYVRPVQVELRGRDAPLLPGEEATFSGDDDAETRVLLGPAREVAWSSASCSGADARVGLAVNMLELRTP